jgi:hypothetical protein
MQCTRVAAEANRFDAEICEFGSPLFAGIISFQLVQQWPSIDLTV